MEMKNFSVSQNIQTGSGATQPPIQWAPGFFPRGKGPKHDFHHSPPSSTEVKNEWSHTSFPLMPSWYLQEQFTSSNSLGNIHRKEYVHIM